MAKISDLINLCELEEDFNVVQNKQGKHQVKVYGKVFPLNHPAPIHLELYRSLEDPILRCKHLKAAHHLFWPDFIKTWNYWDERTFKAVCEDWKYISLAGGASTGKSHRMARLAILFYLANPSQRLVITASTTLGASTARIWGYITRFIDTMAIPYKLHFYTGNNPRIIFNKKDPIHGMYSVAAAKGTSQKAISNWIGKHPDEALLLILDEAPDLDPILLDAVPNLDQQGIEFKCVPIGNSADQNDLHGALSTPEKGWDSIDPMTNNFWETTQKRGCCLFFNCYESPAIHEPNIIKRKGLERFLISEQSIEDKKLQYGEDSVAFWRFVVGFWRSDALESAVITKKFLSHFNATVRTEWSGIIPLQICGGIDPAFSTGGDNCVVRLAVLGQEITGKIVLDFMHERLLFKIPVLASSADSAEMQIATGIINVLKQHQCPFENCALDITGVGRALGELIRMKGNYTGQPIRVLTIPSGRRVVKSFDAQPITPIKLWAAYRDFIQHDQIRGLDKQTVYQLTSRLTEWKNGKEVLEAKQDYRRRVAAINPTLAHSPDEADAGALCIQAAITRLGFFPGQFSELPENIDEGYRKLAAFDLRQYKEAEEARRNYVPTADFKQELATGAPYMNMPFKEES
jgi:hypothetical protein